jgi:hypothetical protein
MEDRAEGYARMKLGEHGKAGRTCFLCMSCEERVLKIITDAVRYGQSLGPCREQPREEIRLEAQ